jgi:hypothetical protein
MKIFKFNTGIYNILLIETPNEVLEGELDKTNKIFTVNDIRVDLNDYLDENSREIKVFGLLSNLQEKHFKSIIPLEMIYKRQFFTQKFKGIFYSMIAEDWDVEAKNTLMIRI